MLTTIARANMDVCVFAHRSEYDGDLQSQLLSKANEEDKNCSRALSVVSAVVRAAKDLLHRAFAVDGKNWELSEWGKTGQRYFHNKWLKTGQSGCPTIGKNIIANVG